MTGLALVPSLCLSLLLAAAATGQTLVRDINATAPGSHSSPANFTASGGLVYFTADDGINGREIWWTNGGQAGMCADIRPGPQSSNPNGFYPFLGGVIAFANDGTNGQEMYWVNNGGAVMLEINPGSLGTAFGFGVVYDTTFFIAAWTPATGYELWATDATSVRLVREIVAGSGNGVADYAGMTVVNDRVLFNGTHPLYGMELWSTDGTAAGTMMVKDISPGTQGALGSGTPLVSDGIHAFFLAYHPSYGNELWMSDGTLAGTVLVDDLVPGTGSSQPQPLLFHDNRLYLRAQTPALGNELFSVLANGGPITVVKDLNPGTGGTSITNVRAAGDLVFFITGSISAGTNQLQRTDGTLAGTFPITGAGILAVQVPGTMEPVGRGTRLLFQGMQSGTGHEPWLTDGTVGGTTRLFDLEPGAAGSFATWFTVTGREVVFTAQQVATGSELFSMPLSLTRGCIVETLLPGCPAANGRRPTLHGQGIPRFGSIGFALHLHRAAANTPAAFVLSFTGVPGATGSALQVGQPIASATILVTDGGGFVSMPLGVPNNPTFLSFQLFAQALVLQPGGCFMGVASLSNGLRIVVGDS